MQENSFMNLYFKMDQKAQSRINLKTFKNCCIFLNNLTKGI